VSNRSELEQRDLFMRSELAALLYTAEAVDGEGRPLVSREGLTAVIKSVTLDSVRSVSGLIRSDTPEDSDGCDRSVDRPSYPLPF